ncbi:MAG: FIST C-terminal domain-containing protein [Candidatus Cloacimonetes bacterium]|nr:FIST C-terminal domain-containing protein [Candidatus Cloacimonadota bacterium]
MIKLYTAITKEVDDPKKAVEEISEQLNFKENMLKNTVGIVHYYYEYIETGVFEALAEALPFKMVGCVTAYVAASGGFGDAALTITMLTSDDADFSIFSLNDLGKKSHEIISEELKNLFHEMSKKETPKVAMTFMSPLKNYSGDDLVAVANSIEKTIPIFGTLAFYLGQDEFHEQIITNNAVSADSLVLLAIYGDVNPKFHVSTSFDFDESLDTGGVITEADGPTLKAVNGISAVQYLKNQDMLTTDNAVFGSAIWAVPAILSYPSGTKVVRAFVTIIDGTEYILATGSMDTGAKIKFSFLDGDKTLASAKKLINDLTDKKENDVIAYSCGARAWALGVNHSGEAKIFEETGSIFKQKYSVPLNYCVAYSGGEICPILNDEGKLVNTLHNYTLIACSFG